VTSPAEDVRPPGEPALHAPAPEIPERPSITESVLDNLSAWTVVAAAISVLYLVWATLEVLDRYVGILPEVGP
jgi:hypothetical protein